VKLYPLEPGSRTAINIQKFCRKYGIEATVPTPKISPDSLVVLGNGTPDDIAFTLIAYHLNGEKIAGIIKPGKKTGLSAIEPALTTVFRSMPGLRKILLLIDQEESPLEEILQGAQKHIQTQGFQIKEEEEKGARLTIFHCIRNSSSLSMIVAINGVDEIPTEKHTIEDHLLMSAWQMGIETERNLIDAKTAWNSLEKDQQDSVFSWLLHNKEKVSELFPQQVLAGGLLKP